jgi:hypothetical protein
MVMLVRRVARYLWGMNAMVFLSLTLEKAVHHRGYAQTAGSTSTAILLIPGLIFAMAWVTNRKAFGAGASSRIWELLASTLLLGEGLSLLCVDSVILLPMGPLPTALPILVVTVGVAAFAQKSRRPATIVAAPYAPVEGDRTICFTENPAGVPDTPPEAELETVSHGQAEWAYSARYVEACYGETSISPAGDDSAYREPVNFQPAPSHEYPDATPAALQAETEEDPSYQPSIQWPSSLRRKYDTA